jgi:multicomponent Na+:H+ antiporter subunit D
MAPLDPQQAADGLDLAARLAWAIPAVGAAGALLARGRSGVALAIGAAWASFAAASVLLIQASTGGPGSAPASGGRHADPGAALALALLTAIGALAASTWARRAAEISAERDRRDRAIHLLWLSALSRAVVGGGLLDAVVFLELGLFAAHVLRGAGAARSGPLVRAHRWLWALGASALAFGVVGTRAATGALDWVQVRVLAADVDPLWIQASFWALAAGGCLTAVQASLGLVLARADDGPAGPARALRAAATAKVALFLLLRVSLGSFGEKFTLQRQPFELLVMVLGAALALGAARALFERRLHDLLAWTSAAQLGGLLLGIGLGNVDGLTGSLTGLWSLGCAESALLLAAAALCERAGSPEIRSLAGIGRAMPLTLGAFALAALVQAGVPPGLGFVARWYLVLGALQSGLWPLALVFLLLALAALLVLGRALSQAWLEPPPRAGAPTEEAPAALLVPMWIAALAAVVLGVAAPFSAGLAARAAGSLLEVAL